MAAPETDGGRRAMEERRWRLQRPIEDISEEETLMLKTSRSQSVRESASIVQYCGLVDLFPLKR
jgi:hypothetical protein